jgi:hypothetical protein
MVLLSKLYLVHVVFFLCCFDFKNFGSPVKIWMLWVGTATLPLLKPPRPEGNGAFWRFSVNTCEGYWSNVPKECIMVASSTLE